MDMEKVYERAAKSQAIFLSVLGLCFLIIGEVLFWTDFPDTQVTQCFLVLAILAAGLCLCYCLKGSTTNNQPTASGEGGG